MTELLYTRQGTDSGEIVTILGFEQLNVRAQNIVNLATAQVKVTPCSAKSFRLQFPQGNAAAFANVLSSMLKPLGVKLRVA